MALVMIPLLTAFMDALHFRRISGLACQEKFIHESLERSLAGYPTHAGLMESVEVNTQFATDDPADQRSWVGMSDLC
jgi:hypothetical protein